MLSTVIDILFCAIDAVLAMWFITKFLKKEEPIYKSIDFWIFVSIHFLINTVALFYTIFSGGVSLLNLVVLVVYSVQMKTRSKTARKIAAPILFEAILALGNGFILVVPTYLLDIEMQQLASEKGVMFYVFGIASKMLLWSLLSLTLRFSNRIVDFKVEDYFLLIVFPLSTIFELAILIKLGLTYELAGYYRYILAATILIILSNVCVYYLVHKIAKHNRIQSEKELYQQLLRYEERRYADIGEGLNQIRKIRHDIKNQLVLVSSKLEDSDIDGAKNLLEDITGNVNSVGNIVQSGNKIVDYIISTKLGTLKDATIIVTGDIQDAISISDVDFSIILGNILDNAIEAAKKVQKPKVELVFFKKDNYQNIIIKNSIERSVFEENADLKTTKEDSTRHGFGIKSVREIVAKYDGDIELFEDEEMFCVHIIFPDVVA